MWKPGENFFVKSHIVSSIATLVCGVCIIVICFFPSFIPSIYKILADDRITIIVPYLLFIALGGSIFSIWHFLIRNKD